MKILGKAREGYIAELSEHEFAWLQGLDSSYDKNYKQAGAGEEYDIKKFIETSRFVRNLDTSRLENITKYLTSALESVGEARETAQALTLFETLKEDYEN